MEPNAVGATFNHVNVSTVVLVGSIENGECCREYMVTPVQIRHSRRNLVARIFQIFGDCLKHFPAIVALDVMVDLTDGRTAVVGAWSLGNRIRVENSISGSDPSFTQRAKPRSPADLVSRKQSSFFGGHGSQIERSPGAKI